MRRAFTLILFTSALDLRALASENSVMEKFRYTSCSQVECVEISAAKAWISLVSGGFTTDGETLMRVLDRDGKEKKAAKGVSATLNPEMKLLILEKKDDGLEMYSLDEKPPGGES